MSSAFLRFSSLFDSLESFYGLAVAVLLIQGNILSLDQDLSFMHVEHINVRLLSMTQTRMNTSGKHLKNSGQGSSLFP